MKFSFTTKNQSPWLEEYYKKYLPDIGYLVEVGVGHLISPTYSLGDYYDRLLCGSNSFDLIMGGWSAILIDPIKEYCEEAKEVYKNVLDRVFIENYGISNKKETLKFYMLDSFLPNTLPKDNNLNYIHKNYELLPLNDLLVKNKCPNDFDLLSIDVEGFELKVLESIDFSYYRPKLIITETCIVSYEDTIGIIKDNYSFLHSDSLNSLFIRK